MRETPSFIVLDFETATREADSACALAMVRLEEGRIVLRKDWLIRPPRRTFEFTYVHGLSWADVAGSPSFGEVWREAAALLDGAGFLAAHNARFDREVLAACCGRAGLGSPELPWLCTVMLARRLWRQHPNTLPAVCGRLGIPLQHHDALSDAEACAGIVTRALGEAGGPDVVEVLLRE